LLGSFTHRFKVVQGEKISEELPSLDITLLSEFAIPFQSFGVVLSDVMVTVVCDVIPLAVDAFLLSGYPTPLRTFRVVPWYAFAIVVCMT
jgi:hypothetical protein